MEEFVNFMVESRTNRTNKKNANRNDINKMKDTNFREFISIIIQNSPEIKIVDKINEGGDVKFSVKMKDLGLNLDSFFKYKNEIFSDFMANFLGGLLVRENISKFSDILTDIDIEEYTSIVNDFEHRQFGMEVSNRNFVFSFHVSLLQSILVGKFFINLKGSTVNHF
jgi:hypothetical protein